ncbi:polysaccharide biosynthesis tyrosine autokinase [Rubritalea tangerina]|uniref:Polysaccharide biosynthesis tyrosine autokinase n=1 Tax=Rubritalea tangerina TaxID=430798 RepID=A0ABW4ZBN6_9BACT
MPADPFADDDFFSQNEELPVNSRVGMSNVRQALGRWWVMLIFGVLGYCGALYYMSIIPTSTEAVAVLEIEAKQDQLIGAEFQSDQLGLEMAMATVVNKLVSPSLLTEVAQSPEVEALQNFLPPKLSYKPRYMREEAELAFQPASEVEISERVRSIADWLDIEMRAGTALLDVKVRHADPEAARTIADTLLRVFVEKEEAQLATGSSDAYKILQGEAEEAKEKLESAETSVQVYVSALRLNEQLQEKRAEVITLRQRYKSKHPRRIQEEALYADLLDRFSREIKRSAAVKSEQAYWLEYRDQLAALEEVARKGEGEEAELAADEWLAIAQNALSSRASLLQKNVAQSGEMYANIVQRMTEIDVSDDKSLTKLKIVEPAFIGTAMESIRLQYLAIGSVVGIACGFGIAFLLSVIDYKIYDVRSAEETTGLTCMAAIPVSSKFGRRKEWDSVLNVDPHSANAEAIRNLRAAIVLLGRQERNKVILVTSAIPGEGKTTVSSEMAAAFALNKERTLLIDMDLRRPKLTDSFGDLKEKPGIVEVLAGQAELDDVIHDTAIDQLRVIGSGEHAPNPSELLHEGDFLRILETLVPRYDRIILDSAPVLPVADSRLLAKHAQAVIMVVRSRKTPIGAIMRARDLLKQAGAKVSGVVVNGMKRAGAGSYHGYKGFGEYGAEDYGYYGGGDK